MDPISKASLLIVRHLDGPEQTWFIRGLRVFAQNCGNRYSLDTFLQELAENSLRLLSCTWANPSGAFAFEPWVYILPELGGSSSGPPPLFTGSIVGGMMLLYHFDAYVPRIYRVVSQAHSPGRSRSAAHQLLSQCRRWRTTQNSNYDHVHAPM